MHHVGSSSDGLDADRRYRPAGETTEEAAGAILDGLEYLVREAHAAGLQDLARALTGVILSPSPRPLRSCITLVVSSSELPSTSGRTTLAVDMPAVGRPKLRVCGRPRKASTVASPELAVRGPVSTATGAPGFFKR